MPRQRHAFADYTAIQQGCQEVLRTNKEGKTTEHYWRWHVRLAPKTGAPAITFHPCRETMRPEGNPPRAPEPVAQLVAWLHRNTRLPVGEPETLVRDSSTAWP